MPEPLTDPVPLAQSGVLFPLDGAGRRVHPKTVAKWARHGARARDGRVVKLPVIAIGRRKAVARSAAAEFVAELNRPVGCERAAREPVGA